MKQLYMFDELYNEMKTRSQTREPGFERLLSLRLRRDGRAKPFPEPLLKKMGVSLPLLLPSGEGAAARSNRRGGFAPVLRHFFQKWICATFPKRGFTGAPDGTRELDVNIEFDLASKAWRANKKYIGDGSFKYVQNKYKESERL